MADESESGRGRVGVGGVRGGLPRKALEGHFKKNEAASAETASPWSSIVALVAAPESQEAQGPGTAGDGATERAPARRRDPPPTGGDSAVTPRQR